MVLLATNREGRPRIEALDVSAATMTARTPTLHVLSIAADGPFRDPRFPTIPFAEDDARDPADFPRVAWRQASVRSGRRPARHRRA